MIDNPVLSHFKKAKKLKLKKNYQENKHPCNACQQLLTINREHKNINKLMQA